MFEKRPIWGLIVGLNVCILIWLISVQEPVVFDVNTAAISSSSSNNFIINAGTIGGEVAAAVGGGESRVLMSKHLSQPNNEYVDEKSGAATTLTTLNLTNNNRYNSNKNNINFTARSTKDTIYSYRNDVKTTTKTSELLADMQSLTSSLGTGVLDLKTKPTPSWATLTAISSALPDEDFNQLIDLHNFQFLMPQPVCGNQIEALILIHSAPKNYEKRQIIRETWASIGHHTADSPLRVLFLLGAVTSHRLQQHLHNENNLYGDLIQGSFVDDYRNMTYKHVMAFKWFLYNCPQAQILIKVDDDVYVNTPQLIKYLKREQQRKQNDINYTKSNPTIVTTVTPNKILIDNINTTTTANIKRSSGPGTTAISSAFHRLNIFTYKAPSLSSASSTSSNAFNASHELFNHPQNLLFCQKIIGSLVKRSYRSKWRVSFKEYSERYYPPYCPGYAIIYSPDVIFRLYKAAQSSRYFWIDDVHITGVLAQQTNTTITNSSNYVLYGDECDQILRGKIDLGKRDFLFAWHSNTELKIKLLWHLQMMSIPTLDELNYNKVELNDGYEMQRQRQQQPDHISSVSNTYTSSNTFR